MVALALRRKGMSIGSIAQKLEISKSSASIWCRDIVLSDRQTKILIANKVAAGFQGRQKGADMNRNRKLNAVDFYIEKSRHQISDLSIRDLLIAGSTLYWAEGSKSESTSGFLFVNSDPEMIIFMKTFLIKIMNVESKDIICTVQVNKIHQPRISKILKFWSSLLELPPTQFNKPFYIKTEQKKVYENYDSYYGILRMKVRKSSNLKYHVLGLIQALKDANMSA